MTSKTIMICEDNRHLRHTIATLLKQEGHTVYEFETADRALALCEHLLETIDVLLTDVEMPGTNGLDFARSLKAKFPDISVLVMSGHTVEKELVEQVEATFFQKPFYYPDLLKGILSAQSFALQLL